MTSTAKCLSAITEDDVIDDANISLIDGYVRRCVRNSVTTTTLSNFLSYSEMYLCGGSRIELTFDVEVTGRLKDDVIRHIRKPFGDSAMKYS